MAGAKIALTAVSGELRTDGNDNARVNLPTTATQAGYTQNAYVPSASVSKVLKITEDNSVYSAESRQIFDLDFNSASTAWSAKIGTNANSMTKAVQNGFMRLNNSAITTTTTGISIYSNRTINIETGYEYVVKFQLKHTNATASNKQAEFGLGYYTFATGQAAQMNEFIGFRFTTAGILTAVVATSQGGAPSETETVIAGFPASDSVSREYQLVITDTSCEFWIEGVYQTRITKPSAAYGLLKSIAYPFIARIFNSGTASAAATFDIADISVIKIGADDGMKFICANRSNKLDNSRIFVSQIDQITPYGPPDSHACVCRSRYQRQLQRHGRQTGDVAGHGHALRGRDGAVAAGPPAAAHHPQRDADRCGRTRAAPLPADAGAVARPGRRNRHHHRGRIARPAAADLQRVVCVCADGCGDCGLSGATPAAQDRPGRERRITEPGGKAHRPGHPHQRRARPVADRPAAGAVRLGPGGIPRLPGRPRRAAATCRPGAAPVPELRQLWQKRVAADARRGGGACGRERPFQRQRGHHADARRAGGRWHCDAADVSGQPLPAQRRVAGGAATVGLAGDDDLCAVPVTQALVACGAGVAGFFGGPVCGGAVVRG